MLNAQQNHFVFIQADNKQPFSVKLNNKSYSSSPSGYVIIPKLIEGKYKTTIAFPGDKYPEQQFFLLIDKKDLGFSLKNFDAKGWGLFNLQTFAITMNGEDISGTDVAAKQPDITTNGTQNSAFGDMLSAVTNDSTLNKRDQTPAETKVIIPEPDKNSEINAGSADTAITVEEIIASNSLITNPVSTEKIQSLPFEIVTDSTQIFLDNILQTQVATQPVKTAVIVDTNLTINPIPVLDSVAENFKPGNNTAVTEVGNPFFNKDSVEENEIIPSTNTVSENNNTPTIQASTLIIKPAYKQDCRSMIENADIERMKRKMVVQDNNDGMIQAAKKYLTNKCITEQQVKTISGLFLSDEGRYLFFDAVYAYVYDYGNFPLLEKQLVDEYYKTRFKAMLR